MSVEPFNLILSTAAVILSGVSLGVSLISLLRGGRARAAARAGSAARALPADACDRRGTDLQLALGRDGGGRDALLIENVGFGAAHQLDLAVEPEPGREFPLVIEDFLLKIPHGLLRPGERVEVLAQPPAAPFLATVHWVDESGERQIKAVPLAAGRGRLVHFRSREAARRRAPASF